MNQKRKEEGKGGAPEGGRTWSTAYMAVAFAMGLTVGFMFGQAYRAFWERRNDPVVERPVVERPVEEGAADAHAGHDHDAHDHSAHDHAGHEHH